MDVADDADVVDVDDVLVDDVVVAATAAVVADDGAVGVVGVDGDAD